MQVGRQRRSECPHEPYPRRIQRFLEPCLLLLLHCSEIHGYELSEALKPFGFEQNPVDPGALYRILRDLEKQGFVTSRWDTDGSGPARHLYLITAEGDEHLSWWVEDLRKTDQGLHYFLETYDEHMEGHR